MSGYGQSNFGKFSVKSDYSLSRNFSPPPQDRIRGEIRRTIIHDRHKMFLWRLAANCLPTKENISRFVNSLDTSCSLCGLESESVIHLFSLCPVTKAIWFGSKWGLSPQFFQHLPAGRILLNPF